MAMRVTQGITNRSYLTNLNTAQYNMNKSMEKLETGRKFSKVSEDVRAATKTIDVRSRLYRNDQVQDNVNAALEEMQMAESIVSEIKDITSEVTAEMFKALNEPSLGAGKETFLSFLDQSKQEVLRLANKQYNNKFLLGGLGVDEEPFKVDDNDKLYYTNYTKKDKDDPWGYSMASISDKENSINDRDYREDMERLGLSGYRPIFHDEIVAFNQSVANKQKSIESKYDKLIDGCSNQITSNIKNIENNKTQINQNGISITENFSEIASNTSRINELEPIIYSKVSQINEKKGSYAEKEGSFNNYKVELLESKENKAINSEKIARNSKNIDAYSSLYEEADKLLSMDTPDESDIEKLIQKIKYELDNDDDDDSGKTLSEWKDELDSQIDSLEEENLNLLQKNDNLDSTINNCSDRMNELSSEITELLNDISKLESEKSELNNTKSSLESRNEKLNNENSKLESDTKLRENRNTYLESENVRLEELKISYGDDKEDEISNLEYMDEGKASYYVNSEGKFVVNNLGHEPRGDYFTQEKYYNNGSESIANSHDNYIDVGAGKFNGSTYSSKFNISVDGIAILGYGSTEMEYEDVTKGGKEIISNNIYDMMTDMQNAIQNEDVDKLSLIMENFKKQSENIVSSVAEIGIRGKFLETNISRLENENSNYAETKNYLEATQDADEITKFKGYQNSWNLILQFGGNVVPKSLMDYIR